MLETTNTPNPNRRWTYSKSFADNLRNQLVTAALDPSPMARNRLINYWFGYHMPSIRSERIVLLRTQALPRIAGRSRPPTASHRGHDRLFRQRSVVAVESKSDQHDGPNTSEVANRSRVAAATSWVVYSLATYRSRCGSHFPFVR